MLVVILGMLGGSLCTLVHETKYQADIASQIAENAPLILPDKDGKGGKFIQNPKNDNSNGFVIFLIILLTFFSLTLLSSLITLFVFFLRKRFTLSEEELLREEENHVYLELDSEEQELYFQSKDYLSENPYFRNDLTLSQNLLIQEKGIHAWEFTRDMMLSNNELTILNKCELNFHKKMECSAQTNLPIPMKNDVYYFETKIYNLPKPDTTKISIGLAIKPYPWFRLPGRHAHSVSYDSDGYRRHNQPFPFINDAPFPRLIEGDVVGIGYRVRSGTIFFTRNGKKLSESKLGGHIKNFKIPNEGQIYPIIGANNECSIHVNLGQMGFVFIEAQVKKWGFAPLEGSGPAPPAYNKFNSDILLERSEIDENEISDRDSDFPPDFWQVQSEDESSIQYDNNDKFSYNAEYETNENAERITLNSLAPPISPPSYDSNLGEEGEEEQGEEDEQQGVQEIQEENADADDEQEDQEPINVNGMDLGSNEPENDTQNEDVDSQESIVKLDNATNSPDLNNISPKSSNNSDIEVQTQH